MKIEKVNINKVKPNPNNPRLIKNDQFRRLVKSIQEFPEMLELREIVVDEDMIVLGGNMRLKALIEAGVKECTVKIAEGLTPEQKKEFVIKDNAAFGEWNFDDLANGFGDLPLADWGIEINKFYENDANKEYEGMPEFENEDMASYKILKIHFQNKEGIIEFAKLINQTISEKTRFVHFPYMKPEKQQDKNYE